jgi:hypothetical protein
MRLAAITCIAALLAAGGCQTQSPSPAPSAIVTGPEAGLPVVGAGDEWGMALYRADLEGVPPGEQVGEPLYP